MSKKALILISEGVEEMEAVIAINILRRGEISVIVAGLSEGPIKCSRDVMLQPDCSLKDALKETYDIVVLPGGMGGANNLAANKAVGECLKDQETANRWIAAICASPAVVLVTHEIGKGKSVTCYPALKDRLTTDYKYVENEVVTDGKLITSQGPATAFPFALSIIENLLGKEKRDSVAKALLYKF